MKSVENIAILTIGNTQGDFHIAKSDEHCRDVDESEMFSFVDKYS